MSEMSVTGQAKKIENLAKAKENLSKAEKALYKSKTIQNVQTENVKIAMLNYGSPNNNPLEYGALITNRVMLKKLDEYAKDIFNDGLQEAEWEQIFKDLGNLLEEISN